MVSVCVCVWSAWQSVEGVKAFNTSFKLIEQNAKIDESSSQWTRYFGFRLGDYQHKVNKNARVADHISMALADEVQGGWIIQL